MNYLKSLFVGILFPILGDTQDTANNASFELEKIINSYQKHKGYNNEVYLLGLYTKAYYKAEAEFEKTLIDE